MHDWLDANLPPLTLALAGGLAEFLTSDEHSWRIMFTSLFLAGFVGYLTILLCGEWGLSEGWTGALTGVSGLSSRGIIVVLKKWGPRELMHRLNMIRSPEESDDDK